MPWQVIRVEHQTGFAIVAILKKEARSTHEVEEKQYCRDHRSLPNNCELIAPLENSAHYTILRKFLIQH